jgi:subtilisin family serine protease
MALDLDLAAEMHLDSARRRTGVDSLQMGFNLPQKFSGKGVVVGVIDAGFDYTHPTFYDTAYQEYRVKKVWEQKNTSGTSPIGFGYGSEFADTTSIFSKKFDINDGTHGTHVAGISSGSGVGSPANNKRRYRGVGYESDMVFTAIYPSAEYWLNTGMVDMLDGIRYTFQYAQSQGKPAVANLSWGCPMGPRDGSSLFSQACNNLVGPGKIFVVSGGNNGQNRIHFTKSFNPADTLTHTFLTFSSNLSPKKILTDIWGDTGKTFEVKFSLYTGSTKTTETSWISLDGLTHDLTLKGANGDTLFITATGLAQEFNQKPHMFLQFFSRINDKLCISIKSDSGTIHMWNGIVVKTSGYYGTFTRFNLPWAKDGDFQYLTGDLVSTKKAISVAAYNTKSSFVNVSNQTQSYSGYQRGRLALFSSVGPTANGKIKPDVAAPGLALASAVSSYDPDYANLGADYASVVGKFISPKNGRTYPFAMAAGTSMAAPMTSGIVALLLQQYPQLDPETLLDWLSQTSISDNFTGTIPGGGNVSWGRGKINGMGLMRKALQITSVGNLSHSEHGILVYPNPAGDRINLYFSERETVLEGIEWADLQGKRLSFEQYQIRKKDENGLWELETGHLKPGIYFLSIQTKTGVEILRIIKD